MQELPFGSSTITILARAFAFGINEPIAAVGAGAVADRRPVKQSSASATSGLCGSALHFALLLENPDVAKAEEHYWFAVRTSSRYVEAHNSLAICCMSAATSL